MKIIADTNIWYYLGQNEALYSKIKDEPISPTFVNIYELSKSENLIDKVPLVRAAIQRLFYFRQNVIYEPPFIYVAKLHNDYLFDPIKEIGNLLEFTSLFAKGGTIDTLRIVEFREILKSKQFALQNGANIFNAASKEIKKRIHHKKSHKKIDTFQITGNFVNFCIETVTNKECNLNGFDLIQIELLIKTLDTYFKTLETSGMKFQANDWYDFAILGYVQPGDKYWTEEGRWKKLIEDAGCDDYLFYE